MLLSEISQWGRKNYTQKKRGEFNNFRVFEKRTPLEFSMLLRFVKYFPNGVKFRNLAMVFNS